MRIKSRNGSKISKVDIQILGGGMVGLALAYQIAKKNKDLRIQILDKEIKLGAHNSGRNSGVLHAGIYYKPGSLKAKVCVDGARRLKEWCFSEDLKVLECGKLIVTQKPDQNSDLELLFERANQNGADVKFIDKKEIKKISKYVYCATEKAIWSPNTCVVDPKLVLDKLSRRIKEMGVEIICDAKISEVNISRSLVSFSSSGEDFTTNFNHLFNCCGVHADEVAKEFGVCDDYKILPFKGIYWKLKNNELFDFRSNIYPVPDLNVPFLGVHVTPNIKGEIFFGPTAIPAFGKENYNGFEKIEPLLATKFIGNLGFQWIMNSNGFRRYAYEQAFQGFKPFFVKAAKSLIPGLKSEHLIRSEKVGIRAQLYNIKKGKLVDDFKLVNKDNTTHVLNAISPAFTASFALADLIIEKSKIF